MGSSSIFSHELRVLACPQCGAPVGSALAGGRVQCGYCGAPSELSARRDVIAPPATVQSESVRLERLRQQDGGPPPVPPGLDGLHERGTVPPERMAEAWTAWLRARRELLAGGGTGSADRLYFLTMAQLGFLARTGRERELRGLLETALDHLGDPRHQQVLHATMAYLAARSGDLVAAERWLALCTPSSDDLQMDSAYRVARAYLETARGDWRTVISTLGFGATDVPIADEHDALCALLRANAHEQSGRLPEASAELLPLALAERLQPLLAEHASLRLCPRTGATVPTQAETMLRDRVKVITVDDVVGKTVLVCLVVYAVLVGVTAIAEFGLGLKVEMDLPLTAAVACAGFVLLILGGGIWRGIFVGRVEKSNVRGRARVLGAELRPGAIEARFLVERPSAEPFVADMTLTLTEKSRANVVTGRTLGADVPSDPRLLTLRWSTE